MYILGVSCWYHDSAATLIMDGSILAAAQEERFSRIKQDNSFPKEAIQYCLNMQNIDITEVDKIVFYDDPSLKFQRIRKTYIDFFPYSIFFILKSFPIWLVRKLYWKKNLVKEFKNKLSMRIDKKKIVNTYHHQSHAASAFFPSPFEEAVILVLDGVGEFDTTSIWVGEKNKLKKIMSLKFPHSLGLLYSSITSYLGFKVNSGEYKIMGLAPYGQPKYVDLIKKHLIDIDDDGSFRLNMKYFDFAIGNRMVNENFSALFKRSARKPESDLTEFEMDMAASIQKITEEIMLKLALLAHKKTGKKNLCLAGGVALNCVGNGILLKEKIFQNIWIQPAAGDAGGSLGAALDYYYNVLENKRIINPEKIDFMKGSYLGPSYSDIEVEKYLNKVNAPYKKFECFDTLIDSITNEIIDGKVIGWHQGRMEFGPRALGNRTIIGDARSQQMQTIINLKIKYRESFRPFAPSVLSEKASDWFQIDTISPYMLLVADVHSSKIIRMSQEEESLFGIEKLKRIRSLIPAVTHVDYSARIQTVHRETNEKYHKLISAFEQKTGCPVIVNTSFNVRGEPIVCTPEDSYKCFMRTEMDVLVIENYVMYKNEQPCFEDSVDWKSKFQLD